MYVSQKGDYKKTLDVVTTDRNSKANLMFLLFSKSYK